MVTDLQYAAINFAHSQEINKHAFVFMGCGSGKSGIYNLLLLWSYLNQAAIPHCLVISPHNSLLAMHKTQSKHYLRGTTLNVASLLPGDVQKQEFPTNFELLYISIHAFNELIHDHKEVLTQWNITNIFVNEYHNVVSKLFRFNSSWKSLRLCASLNKKIMFLSATTDRILMKYTSNFFGIGDLEVIGSTTMYSVPEVKICVIKNHGANNREHLLQIIVNHCTNLTKTKKESYFKIHAITMSRQDAIHLSDQLNNSGLKAMWLTSKLSTSQKSYYLQKWENGDEQVLVSTFTDVIDNSSMEDVIIVGGTYSLYSLVQAIGRIRPKRQKISKSTIFIFHYEKYIQFEDQLIDDIISRAIGAEIFLIQRKETAKAYYKKCFIYVVTRIGLTNQPVAGRLCMKCFLSNQLFAITAPTAYTKTQSIKQQFKQLHN